MNFRFLVLTLVAALFFISVGSFSTNQIGRVKPALGATSVSQALCVPVSSPTITMHRLDVRPVSDAVARVMPGLKELPSDWREYNPDRIVVTLAPGVVVPFDRVSVTEKDGRVFWTGKSPVDGGQLFAVATKGSWFAAVNFQHGNDYMVRVAGQGASVTEAAPENFKCASEALPAASVATSFGAASPATPDANGVYTVDIAFFYNDDCVTDATVDIQNNSLSVTPLDYITSTVLSYLQAANAMVTNSSVTNLKWNGLGVWHIPAYTVGTTTLNPDLNIMTDQTTAAGKFVQQKMADTGADECVLYVGGTRGGEGGLAWLPGHYAACLFNNSFGTLPHELGHTMGCHHDRITESASDNDGHYYYGSRWTDSNGWDCGDIMSYAGANLLNEFQHAYRISSFGNPSILYEGLPTGVAPGQPKAADCAQVLIDNAAAMASYNSAPSAPQISSQPASTSVTTGQTFFLSVTVAGGDMSYQWYQNGAAISGATASTYSKASTSTDAGSYTVTAMNPAGSVTSNAATVNVTTPAPTPSGGGGGGGGAPSSYYMIILVVLAGLRRFVRGTAP